VSGFGTKEEFFGALRENRERADGRAKAAIAEEIADESEAFGDDEVTATALVELMSAYRGSGERVKYPVVFARLLRLWDRNPKAFDDWEAHRVFWYFKWVGSGLLGTPDVPLAAIRGWIAEMRKRYEAADYGLQPVYGQLHFLAQHIGEGEEPAYELWATRGRTRMSDCEACEARARAEYHFGRGEDENGMAELEATLEGRSTCDEEPHASQSSALLPLVRLGRTDEARGAHLSAYRAVRGREAYLTEVGRHLEFCALTGNEARGLELLAQNRALFGFTAAPLGRLDFLTRVEVLLRRLAAVGHGDTPCGGPLGREWTVAELLASVAADADALATRFDARNGNATVSGQRAAQLALEPLVAELNLGVRAAALEGTETPLVVPTAGSAALVSAAAVSQVPETAVPDDFDALVAEALLLDRQFHPDSRRLWDVLLSRAAGPDADKVDDVLRGEIATERASRAHQERDWDAVNTHFTEAAECYERAGRPDRAIASAARVQWSKATRGDQDADASSVVEETWPELNTLLQRIDVLLADGGLGPNLADAQVQKLVVHQSRVFAARNAAMRAADPADAERWLGVFRAETDRMVREGNGFDAPQRLALVLEAVAEYDATHDDPKGAEPLARHALQIFTDLGWPWRLHRSRMLLGLALAGQDRYAEAMQVLQTGIAEAHPAVDADELTPLYRLLAETALQGGEPATAVRAFAEAAVRLDREGDAFGAVETRWRMSNALAAQGQTADAVAVLETLVETPLRQDGEYAGAGAGAVDTADEARARDELIGEAALAGGQSAADAAPSTAGRDAGARVADELAGAGESVAAADPGTAGSGSETADGSAVSAVASQTDAAAMATDTAARVADELAGAGEPVAGAEQAVRAPSPKPFKHPTRTDMLMVQVRADLARGLLALDEPRAAAVEFLHVADAVDGWPDASRLTAAAAEAAGALALARNWEGARAAWERAVASNLVAPRVPDMTEALRDMAGETINAFGAEGADDALGYLAEADRMRVDFAEQSRTQFLSIEVDEAQTCYTRGWVLNAAGRPEEAIEQLERASMLYDRPGFSGIPPRFDAIRQAAVIEYRSLDREDAAKARLDNAIADAELAGHSDGVTTLRKLRDALR
jgi:tetratricopeptide (TPR) repeat protein